MIKLVKFRPVYVSWTSGVYEWEASLIIKGMREIIQFARITPEIKVFGSRPWADPLDPYSSPDWYQNHNIIQLPRRHKQVDADGVVNDLLQEPWRKIEDHIDLMIFDMDFNARIPTESGRLEWINFIFGQGGPSFGSIQSVYRFRQTASSTTLYKLALRWIGRHEFGHILGLVDPKRNTADKRDGLYRGHCGIYPCTMNQRMSINGHEGVEQLVIDLQRSKRIICPDCIKELKIK